LFLLCAGTKARLQAQIGVRNNAMVRLSCNRKLAFARVQSPTLLIIFIAIVYCLLITSTLSVGEEQCASDTHNEVGRSENPLTESVFRTDLQPSDEFVPISGRDHQLSPIIHDDILNLNVLLWSQTSLQLVNPANNNSAPYFIEVQKARTAFACALDCRDKRGCLAFR
jgi:hypothetical protein